MTVTKTIMATFLGNPHFGQPYAENLNTAYEELQELVERINVELNFVDAMDEVEAEVGQQTSRSLNHLALTDPGMFHIERPMPCNISPNFP